MRLKTVIFWTVVFLAPGGVTLLATHPSVRGFFNNLKEKYNAYRA